MDTLIKALKNRSHNIKCENGGMHVIIGDEKIQIFLKERVKRNVNNSRGYPTYEYISTGEFAFKIEAGYVRRELSDGKEKLEEKLFSIVAKLEVEGERMKEETIQWRKAKAEREEKERIALELKKRREKALSDFSDLYYKSQQWNQVTLIRNYIDDLEAKAKARNALTDELKDWLFWARKKADWFDPTVEAEDDLLNDDDKKRLLQSFESSTNNNNNISGYGYFGMSRDDNYWRKPWYSR